MFVRLRLGPVLLIPRFGARVCAGFPSPADDYIEDDVDLTRLPVLLVEDEHLIAHLVEDDLRDEGLDVLVAHSGTEAVNRLAAELSASRPS